MKKENTKQKQEAKRNLLVLRSDLIGLCYALQERSNKIQRLGLEAVVLCNESLKFVFAEQTSAFIVACHGCKEKLLMMITHLENHQDREVFLDHIRMIQIIIDNTK